MGFSVGRVLGESDPGLLEARVAGDMHCSFINGNQVLVLTTWLLCRLLQRGSRLLWLRSYLAIGGMNFFFFMVSALKAPQYIF